MRTRILFSHKRLLFCIVTLSLLFCGISFSVASTVSTGRVGIVGSDVSANIPKGAHYQHEGKRKLSDKVEVTPEGVSRRVVVAEKWKAPLGKAPDITIFTFKVTAYGQGRVLLTLNQEKGGGTSPQDVGSYRGYDDPVSLAEDEAAAFYVYQHVPHENIREYESGFDSPYDDDCVPVKHKGYDLEVVSGQEDLVAKGKVYTEKISISYGTEKSAQQALGLTGGWGTATIEADFVNGTKRTWGWNLVDDPKNFSGDSMDSSFRVTVENEVSIGGKPLGPACEVCDNCGDYVHQKNDHYLGLCPLDPSVLGCGEKRWSCETSKDKAWHQIRYCYHTVAVPIMFGGLWATVCPEKFRHCKNASCDFRIKRERGHSDGTTSQAPANVTNAYANSHLSDDPPTTATATLTASDGSSTATAGSSFTADLSVPSGYTLIYWYIKAPGESGYGTSVETTSGDGSSTTASYTYSLPSGASGDYVLTAYAYLSDSTIAEPSYTVSVSSGGSSTPAPAPSPGLSPAGGSYTASTGESHTASLTTSVPYSTVYWYVLPPWDTSSYYGTNEQTDYGDGVATETSFSYVFNGNGSFKITAYIYTSDNNIQEYSYTVDVQ